MAQDKKGHIISYENLPEDVAAAFAEKYPKGYHDYLEDLNRYTKPDGTSFFAVLLEMPHDIYMIKMKVKTDDIDDIERWLEGEDDADGDVGSGANVGSSDDSGTLPDDNISQYGTEDDSDAA